MSAGSAFHNHSTDTLNAPLIHRMPGCELLMSRVKKIKKFFYKRSIFLFKSDFVNYLIFFKSGIQNVIKYLTIRLSGVNTATQVCALCAFVLKNTQNFVDLDACKQLFVLNSYKSVIKKSEVKKIINQ